MTRTVFLGAPEGKMLRGVADDEARERGGRGDDPPGSPAPRLTSTPSAFWPRGLRRADGTGLGHGVGIDIHEQPVLNPRNFKPLAAATW